MDSLYIVMPAYNEEENIKEVVKAWYPLLSGKNEKSRLVISDSGSTDKTHAILEEMKKSFPKLEILSDTDRQHGPKLFALYDYAIKSSADYIFQTDSDGQTNPAEFEEFWNCRGGADVICGNRHEREDGKSRIFVEIVLCLLLKLYFGVSVPDANAPFRLMKTDIVEKYLYHIPEDYSLTNIMMTVYFVYFKEHICFKEITFKPRQGGTNSLNMLKIVKIACKALYDFHYFKKDMVE